MCFCYLLQHDPWAHGPQIKGETNPLTSVILPPPNSFPAFSMPPSLFPTFRPRVTLGTSIYVPILTAVNEFTMLFITQHARII